MVAIPSHRDFIDGVTPADLRKYPHGLWIVIDKIRTQTKLSLDTDGSFNMFLDLLLLDDRAGLKKFFSWLSDSKADGMPPQLNILSSLYRLTAWYSAPRELWESSELSAQQLYNLSNDFFQSVLVFLHDTVLTSDLSEYHKNTAINTISEYTQYIIRLIEKAKKERETILSRSNYEKRTIDEREWNLKRKLKSILLGKDYVDNLKKDVDTQVSPELNENTQTLLQIAGRLKVIDAYLISTWQPGVKSLDLPSSLKSTLDTILK